MNVININYKSLSKTGMKKLFCCKSQLAIKLNNSNEYKCPVFDFNIYSAYAHIQPAYSSKFHTQRNHAPTDHVEIQHLHIHCIDSSVGFLIRIRIIF